MKGGVLMDSYDAMVASAAAGVLIVYYLFFLAFMILVLVGYWKIFTKAGKPGWAIKDSVLHVVV